MNTHENQRVSRLAERQVAHLRKYLEGLIEEHRDDHLDMDRECWSVLRDPPRGMCGQLFHCSFDETIYTFSTDEDHDMTIWEAQQVARTADAIRLLVSGDGDWAIEHLQTLLDKGEPADWILLAGADMAFDAPTTNRRWS